MESMNSKSSKVLRALATVEGQDVFVVTTEVNTQVLYTWLSDEEVDYLQMPIGVDFLRCWLASLDVDNAHLRRRRQYI